MEKLILNLKNKLQKNKKIIKIFSNLILLVVSFGILIYFCAENNNWNKIINGTQNLNASWVVLSFFAVMLSWYFDSLTIFEIIGFFEKKHIKKSKIYKISIIGQYFTAITPMGIGSAPAQTSELTKINIEKNNAASIIAAKLMVYQISLAIYSLSCAIAHCLIFNIQNHLIPIYLLIGLGLQIFMVCLVLIFLTNKNFFIKIENISKNIPIILKYKKPFKKIKSSINFFAGALKSILQDKLLMIKLFLYSFIQISLVFSIPFFIFKAFNHSSFPAIEIIQTQCVANTVCSFTPLPGNAGTSEKIFIDLFQNFFFENEIVIAMIIHRMITFYFSIIIGAIVYFCSKKRSSANR